MTEKKYNKEQLERSRLFFLGPRIDSSISYARKSLDEGNMTGFAHSSSIISRDTEHHIILRCTKAENENLRIDCVTKSENMRIKAINKLGEMLTERCGGKMEYIEEI